MNPRAGALGAGGGRMTIWITLRTAVSANVVPAQYEDIIEMFEKVKRGERVYDAFNRDVTFDVVEEMITLSEYNAMKIYMENKVCEFFGKLKGEEAPEDMVLAAAIARLYVNVDKYTVTKAIWNKDPSLIPTPPKCLSK
jgi:hypothetical protein